MYTKADFENNIKPPDDEIKTLAKCFKKPVTIGEGFLLRFNDTISKEEFSQAFWTLKYLEKHGQFNELTNDLPPLYCLNLSLESKL